MELEICTRTKNNDYLEKFNNKFIVQNKSFSNEKNKEENEADKFLIKYFVNKFSLLKLRFNFLGDLGTIEYASDI